MKPIAIRIEESGRRAYLAEDLQDPNARLFENPEQLADSTYTIADLSAMINAITGKASRQPSIARAANRLFKVLGSNK